jgi:hypothetical protein
VARSDAFAFKKSGLNAFLFAEVGTELNGSTLTILSVLARLGQDPWAEAARWAKLPKAAIIDVLAQSIGQMPLSPQALGDARKTASRLILLLPSQNSAAPVADRRPVGIKWPAMPRWLPVALVLGAVALGILTNAMMSSTTTPSPAPMGQAFDHTK